MATIFKKLNSDWNAEPNSPIPRVAVWEHDILLSFYLNAFVFEQFEEGDIGHLRFRNCRRYRLGGTNDEGWSRGQCRFSRLAPGWGEFYEVTGDLFPDKCPKDWVELFEDASERRHYLFYFRDQTFECEAESWSFSISK